jgi:ribonucleoside-diphosphate reductase alpha chain
MSTNGTVAPAVRSEHASRQSLPRERQSLTHKFEIAGHEGYVTVGFYDDGRPGEIFLWGFGKDGSFIQCMMGCWGKSMSNALQYGQPIHKLVTNYLDMRFEPFGATSNPEIPKASSIPDYIARWLALHFLSADERDLHGIRIDQTR